ncbi:aminotransferase class III-fold pyridoxal phosphate-dependent enzyme [Ekhidna sp.]|uniref:aspartate aminotransferase family protein n=1 Tax=Ekhidna sp. TaxID=2608089 RepID=UPI00329A0018
MELFEVYPRLKIEPVQGDDCYVLDENGSRYLDLYGGHAVISIGHNHPHYINGIESQLNQIAFYSNSVEMSIQDKLAYKLGKLSGYEDYAFFLCNSGAEAIENALKIAAFHTEKKKIIVFENGFHGRTSLAIEATDNEKIQAPVNHTGNFIRLPLNDEEMLESTMDDSVAAVLVEGIQGISGVHIPSDAFMKKIEKLCSKYGAAFIVDEIQSGYGRTGKFFAHQYADVNPDIITVAKGMGNGFPIGGVLVNPNISPWMGMLGTTFGGSHLACAAGLAVLDVLEQEELIKNAFEAGEYLMDQLKGIDSIQEVRGRGLMIGIDLPVPGKEIREQLLFDHHIFIGSSSKPNTIRILPPLTITQEDLDYFIQSFKSVLG